jgi:hypothetical protein
MRLMYNKILIIIIYCFAYIGAEDLCILRDPRATIVPSNSDPMGGTPVTGCIQKPPDVSSRVVASFFKLLSTVSPQPMGRSPSIPNHTHSLSIMHPKMIPSLSYLASYFAKQQRPNRGHACDGLTTT